MVPMNASRDNRIEDFLQGQPGLPQAGLVPIQERNASVANQPACNVGDIALDDGDYGSTEQTPSQQSSPEKSKSISQSRRSSKTDGISSEFMSTITRLIQVYENDLQKLEEKFAASSHATRLSFSSTTSEASHVNLSRCAPKSQRPSEDSSGHAFIFDDALDKEPDTIMPTPSQKKVEFQRSLSTEFRLRKHWRQEKVSPAYKAFSDLSKSGTNTLDGIMDAIAQRTQAMSKPKVLGRSRCIMHPASYKRAAWDICSMVCLLWDCLTVPFVLAFEPPSSNVMRVLTIITTVFWTLDIGLGFLTGYQIERNGIEMNPRNVAVNYCCKHLPVDLTVVSIDWVFVIGESAEKSSIARLGRSVRILKLFKTLKLLRTMKLKKYIRAIQDMITSEVVSIWFGIFRVIAILLLVNHIVACLWYLIGTIDCQCGEPGWVDENMKNHDLAYKYVSALHWALAQFTPAPNEIFPNNVYERLFATAVLMGALVSFSAVTGTITAGVMQIKMMSSEESRQFWQLRRYLREWRIPNQFRRRVIAYLEYAYSMQRKRIQEKDVALLTLLSEQLQFQLRRMTLREHLHRHPLFYRLHYSTLAFIKALGTRALASGDTLCKSGEEATQMYFITEGFMEYMKPFRGQELTEQFPAKYSTTTLAYGEWICEMVLWTAHWIFLGHAVSENQCQVITIHGKDFGKAIQINFDLWTRVQRYACKYVDDLNSLDHHSLSDIQVFDDHEDFLDDILPRPIVFTHSLPLEASWRDYLHELLPRRMRHWMKQTRRNTPP